ncbi:clotting factor B-like [Uloborus diversus]|uniref:clotting factor B-like n=1 Tax=Uloborus diversus TaxID=327109 RepID=UPI0024096BE6|nr:clotting factor B-like [Uloborus diversus]
MPATTSDYNSFIMNGVDVKQGEYPWMVAVMSKVAEDSFIAWCTGFMIDRRHVVSAAHCFENTNPRRFSARIGDIYYNNGTRYDVVNIVRHASYSSPLYYDDIAILTLDRDVQLPGFNPVCLPDSELEKQSLVGSGATVVGWGASRLGGDMSLVLQQLNSVPIVSNRDCNRAFRQMRDSFSQQFPRGITAGFICAGFPEGKRDSCSGDSGGPLMVRHRNRWFVVGIVSFGYECGKPSYPGGYTRIAYYLKWIQRVLQKI